MATPKLEIDQQLIDKANDYQAVVSDARWKRLIDNLAIYNDSILTQMRLCGTADREKFNELALMWKYCENYLTMIQNEVFGTLQQRADYIRNMLKGRLQDDHIEDILRRQNGGS